MATGDQAARSRKLWTILLVVVLILGLAAGPAGYMLGSATPAEQVAGLTTEIDAAHAERDRFASQYQDAEATRAQQERQFTAELDAARAERDSFARQYRDAEAARAGLLVQVQQQERWHRCVLRTTLDGTRVALSGYRIWLTATDTRSIFRRLGPRATTLVPVLGAVAALGVQYHVEREVDRELHNVEERIEAMFHQGRCATRLFAA